MDKQSVIYSSHRIPICNKMEVIIVTYTNTDNSQKHSTEIKKQKQRVDDNYFNVHEILQKTKPFIVTMG